MKLSSPVSAISAGSISSIVLSICTRGRGSRRRSKVWSSQSRVGAPGGCSTQRYLVRSRRSGWPENSSWPAFAATTIVVFRTAAARRSPSSAAHLGAHHQVEFAGAQHGREAVDQSDHRLQRHLGRFLQQLPRHRRQQELRRGGHDADAHVAGQPAGDVVDLAPGVLDVEAQLARPLQQHLAGDGEADAAAGLLEQRRAAGLFEPAHAVGQRRLRAVQLLGCPADVLQRGDGLEVAQVAQVHVESHVNEISTTLNWTVWVSDPILAADDNDQPRCEPPAATLQETPDVPIPAACSPPSRSPPCASGSHRPGLAGQGDPRLRAVSARRRHRHHRPRGDAARAERHRLDLRDREPSRRRRQPRRRRRRQVAARRLHDRARPDQQPGDQPEPVRKLPYDPRKDLAPIVRRGRARRW